MPSILPQTTDEKTAGTWTDSSRIYEALADAEARFGRRDTSFTLTGYEFKVTGPFLAVDPSARLLEIWLQGAIQNEPDQVLFQAAHEIVHVLSPVSALEGPSVLDEGLAQLFSEQHTLRQTGKLFRPPTDKRNYADARDAVAAYVADDELIREVRSHEPIFSRITPDLLLKVRPDCPRDLAKYLCSKFQT